MANQKCTQIEANTLWCINTIESKTHEPKYFRWFFNNLAFWMRTQWHFVSLEIFTLIGSDERRMALHIVSWEQKPDSLERDPFQILTFQMLFNLLWIGKQSIHFFFCSQNLFCWSRSLSYCEADRNGESKDFSEKILNFISSYTE